MVQEEFTLFAQICEKLSHTKSTKEKVNTLAQYLEELSEVTLAIAVNFLSGRIFDPESKLLLNLAQYDNKCFIFHI